MIVRFEEGQESGNFTGVVPTAEPTFRGPVFIEPGHWKLSDSTFTPLVCPYESTSCEGGYLGGDYSCVEGFTGPLCALAVSDNFVDWAIRDSVTCSYPQTFAGIAVYCSMLILCTLHICRKVGAKSGIEKKFEKKGDLLLSMHAKNESERGSLKGHATGEASPPLLVHPVPVGTCESSSIVAYSVGGMTHRGRKGVEDDSKAVDLLIKLKILITSLQICSSLPNSLYTTFPPMVARVLQIFGYLGLTTLKSFAFECLSFPAPIYHVDFHNVMEISSIVPILLSVLLALFYLVHREVLYITVSRYRAAHRRISKKYSTLFFLFAYICMGGITMLALGSFQCVNIDPDSVMTTKFVVLEVDMRVDCLDGQYGYAALWAVLVIIMYPFGLLLMEVLLLYYHKEQIQVVQYLRLCEHRHAALLSTSHSSAANIFSAATTLSTANGADSNTGSTVALTAPALPVFQQRSLLSTADLHSLGRCDRFLDNAHFTADRSTHLSRSHTFSCESEEKETDWEDADHNFAGFGWSGGQRLMSHTVSTVDLHQSQSMHAHPHSRSSLPAYPSREVFARASNEAGSNSINAHEQHRQERERERVGRKYQEALMDYVETKRTQPSFRDVAAAWIGLGPPSVREIPGLRMHDPAPPKHLLSHPELLSSFPFLLPTDTPSKETLRAHVQPLAPAPDHAHAYAPGAAREAAEGGRDRRSRLPPLHSSYSRMSPPPPLSMHASTASTVSSTSSSASANLLIGRGSLQRGSQTGLSTESTATATTRGSANTIVSSAARKSKSKNKYHWHSDSGGEEDEKKRMLRERQVHNFALKQSSRMKRVPMPFIPSREAPSSFSSTLYSAAAVPGTQPRSQSSVHVGSAAGARDRHRITRDQHKRMHHEDERFSPAKRGMHEIGRRRHFDRNSRDGEGIGGACGASIGSSSSCKHESGSESGSAYESELEAWEDELLSVAALFKSVVSAENLSLLFQAYKPQFWFWEAVDVFSRLFFMAVLPHTLPHSTFQVIAALVVALVLTRNNLHFRPYCLRENQWLADVAHYQTVGLLVCALVLQLHDDDRDHVQAVDYVGMVVCSLTPLSAAYIILLKPWLAEHWPRIQRSLALSLGYQLVDQREGIDAAAGGSQEGAQRIIGEERRVFAGDAMTSVRTVHGPSEPDSIRKRGRSRRDMKKHEIERATLVGAAGGRGGGKFRGLGELGDEQRGHREMGRSDLCEENRHRCTHPAMLLPTDTPPRGKYGGVEMGGVAFEERSQGVGRILEKVESKDKDKSEKQPMSVSAHHDRSVERVLFGDGEQEQRVGSDSMRVLGRGIPFVGFEVVPAEAIYPTLGHAHRESRRVKLRSLSHTAPLAPPATELDPPSRDRLLPGKGGRRSQKIKGRNRQSCSSYVSGDKEYIAVGNKNRLSRASSRRAQLSRRQEKNLRGQRNLTSAEERALSVCGRKGDSESGSGGVTDAQCALARTDESAGWNTVFFEEQRPADTRFSNRPSTPGKLECDADADTEDDRQKGLGSGAGETMSLRSSHRYGGILISKARGTSTEERITHTRQHRKERSLQCRSIQLGRHEYFFPANTANSAPLASAPRHSVVQVIESYNRKGNQSARLTRSSGPPSLSAISGDCDGNAAADRGAAGRMGEALTSGIDTSGYDSDAPETIPLERHPISLPCALSVSDYSESEGVLKQTICHHSSPTADRESLYRVPLTATTTSNSAINASSRTSEKANKSLDEGTRGASMPNAKSGSMLGSESGSGSEPESESLCDSEYLLTCTAAENALLDSDLDHDLRACAYGEDALYPVSTADSSTSSDSSIDDHSLHSRNSSSGRIKQSSPVGDLASSRLSGKDEAVHSSLAPMDQATKKSHHIVTTLETKERILSCCHTAAVSVSSPAKSALTISDKASVGTSTARARAVAKRSCVLRALGNEEYCERSHTTKAGVDAGVHRDALSRGNAMLTVPSEQTSANFSLLSVAPASTTVVSTSTSLGDDRKPAHSTPDVPEQAGGIRSAKKHSTREMELSFPQIYERETFEPSRPLIADGSLFQQLQDDASPFAAASAASFKDLALVGGLHSSSRRGSSGFPRVSSSIHHNTPARRTPARGSSNSPDGVHDNRAANARVRGSVWHDRRLALGEREYSDNVGKGVFDAHSHEASPLVTHTPSSRPPLQTAGREEGEGSMRAAAVIERMDFEFVHPPPLRTPERYLRTPLPPTPPSPLSFAHLQTPTRSPPSARTATASNMLLTPPPGKKLPFAMHQQVSPPAGTAPTPFKGADSAATTVCLAEVPPSPTKKSLAHIFKPRK